jgi:hypothetical protein
MIDRSGYLLLVRAAVDALKAAAREALQAILTARSYERRSCAPTDDPGMCAGGAAGMDAGNDHDNRADYEKVKLVSVRSNVDAAHVARPPSRTTR